MWLWELQHSQLTRGKGERNVVCEYEVCMGQSGGSIDWVPRPGPGLKQVSFWSAELVQVFLFATSNLSESPFVGNRVRGQERERERKVKFVYQRIICCYVWIIFSSRLLVLHYANTGKQFRPNRIKLFLLGSTMALFFLPPALCILSNSSKTWHWLTLKAFSLLKDMQSKTGSL